VLLSDTGDNSNSPSEAVLELVFFLLITVIRPKHLQIGAKVEETGACSPPK
jgi:hypothetical protein